MKIKFVLENGKRRPLANALSEILGTEARYLGAPTFTFDVGGCTIDKDGTLHIPEGMDGAALLEKLDTFGFVHEPVEGMEQGAIQGQTDEPLRTAILLPAEDFGDTALANLTKLIEAKAGLIRLSLRVDSLAVSMEDDVLRFDWFDRQLTPEELAAYTQFLSTLCRTAKEQIRVSAKATPVENPRYQMRCLLLKLGFIGQEYAAARKLLTAGLPGNASFKNGK